MEQLTGTTRHYPWGSRTLLADLRGLPSPSPRPEAEIWFGAHPAAPSHLGERSLIEVIAADPVAALGERVAEKFDGELPFLVKLLAADEPLSLQAHPSAEQAREATSGRTPKASTCTPGTATTRTPSTNRRSSSR